VKWYLGSVYRTVTFLEIGGAMVSKSLSIRKLSLVRGVRVSSLYVFGPYYFHWKVPLFLFIKE
jgi:hypothetical protein